MFDNLVQQVANNQFMSQLDSMVGQADPSMPKVLAKDALQSMDLGDLSPNERTELLSQFESMTADREVSQQETNELFDMINKFTGSDWKTPFPNAQGEGQAEPVDNWPMPNVDQEKMPGNPLVNGMVKSLSDLIGHSMNDTVFNNTVNTLLSKVDGNFGSDTLDKLFNQADLSKLNGTERSDLINQLFHAQADGTVSNGEAFSIGNSLYNAQGPEIGIPGGEVGIPLPSGQGSDIWSVEQPDNGQANIDLGDYTLNLNEDRSEMTLTNKETGEESRIWGDPHFDMDNDGRTDVDFWGTMTMNLENGTKITIETTPWNGNQDMTLASKLTITQGSKAMVVEGLDQNQKGDLTIEQSENGYLLDAQLKDGLDIYENPNGANWLVQDGSQMRELTQTDTNKTKGEYNSDDDPSLVNQLNDFTDKAASFDLQQVLMNFFIAQFDVKMSWQ